MKKILFIFGALFLVLGAYAQDFAGFWHGLAQVGPQTLRITFDLKNSDGTWSGAMQSPDQSPQWIPMSGVAAAGDTLKIQIAPIGFSYTGVLNGGMIRGTFTQTGNTFPLDLARDEVVLNRPQEPKPPYPYAVEEVKFSNHVAGITLVGTLTSPADGGACPVVILVSGTGAQDRDETIATHRPFAVIADYLTRRGIAVLRCDDRGTGESEGNYALATIQDFATDTEAAIEYIKTRKRFSAAPLGIIGHSQGGMVALMLAAGGKADFIVTLAGPGVDGRKLLEMQQIAIVKASGAPDSFLVPYSRKMHEAVSAILRLENRAELRDTLTTLFAGTSLEGSAETIVAQLATPEIRSFLRFDPAVYFPAVKCPVLALNGEKDLQVPAGPNLDGFRNGLKHNEKATIRSCSGLNHLFQTATTGLPAEYGTIEETFSPLVLQEMADWILETTR